MHLCFGILENKLYLKKRSLPIQKLQQHSLENSVAKFEGTLSSSNCRFDQFLSGDQSVLSMGEKEWFELFKKAGCINCQNAPRFLNYKMHVLSVADNAKLKKI